MAVIRSYENVEWTALGPEARIHLGACHLLGRWVEYTEIVDGVRDYIDLKCDEAPCECDQALSHWRVSWSKMPSRRV